SDGTTAWVAAVSGTYNQFSADFQGGLGVLSYTLNADGTQSSSILKLDGLTGQAYPAYSVTSPNGYARWLRPRPMLRALRRERRHSLGLEQYEHRGGGS
ncbi:MAG TPA: hypothetical protein VKG25_00150, partial [Bryobacteraceae bacterium]|nr:hypothetical protein [Bryobacteraceae bacterium]